MCVGVVISLFNHLHFGNTVDVFCEFIPRIVFIGSFFGYMVFVIIYKWCLDWAALGTHRAPSLIVTLINMVLGFGRVGSDNDQFDPDPPVPLFDSQSSVQKLLITLALCAVPVMLFPKPLVLWFLHWKKQRADAVSAYHALAAEPRQDGEVQQFVADEPPVEHEHVNLDCLNLFLI